MTAMVTHAIPNASESHQAIPKLQGRGWYWIDDEVKYFEKEIKELNLPKERCIQVSDKGAGRWRNCRIGWRNFATMKSR